MEIKIEKVSKTFGKKQALEDISLTIPSQSCYGLLGPNGAGKSTLMKIITGVILDYSGDVVVDNQKLNRNLPAIQRKIGYVSQEISLEPTLSAQDNLMFFGRMYGLSGSTLKERVAQVLAQVGLTNRRKDLIHTYSGGMKRRINIGVALLHQPELLIMDEPTVGVDPQSRNYIFELIRSLKASGTTIIYSSHYMEEIQTLCDELALIDEGQVVEAGSLTAIRKRHTKSSVFVKGADLSADNLAQYGLVHEQKGGFTVETETPLQTLQQISSALQTSNLVVEQLEISQSNLEDIFLSLTGSSLRDHNE
ncbi:ABC-2 type transport system ATP-binding protein [Amphibacillus marinus]|uniref:ABC-2 type transport system ATP-binding protein n=1 Tax=Amphibacillus marinus TaxID=872970 RepID=A0A1H8KF70_9BACI|nr:ABC transporter ATP-binding protein [Amphibacillus marinus]SEN91633.1 ABC-2 type transport system ATP-binding protein [Amphibacillus marinus]